MSQKNQSIGASLSCSLDRRGTPPVQRPVRMKTTPGLQFALGCWQPMSPDPSRPAGSRNSVRGLSPTGAARSRAVVLCPTYFRRCQKSRVTHGCSEHGSERAIATATRNDRALAADAETSAAAQCKNNPAEPTAAQKTNVKMIPHFKLMGTQPPQTNRFVPRATSADSR